MSLRQNQYRENSIFFSPPSKSHKDDIQLNHYKNQTMFQDEGLSQIGGFNENDGKANSQDSNTLAQLVGNLQYDANIDQYAEKTIVHRPKSQILYNQSSKKLFQEVRIKKSQFYEDFGQDLSFSQKQAVYKIKQPNCPKNNIHQNLVHSEMNKEYQKALQFTKKEEINANSKKKKMQQQNQIKMIDLENNESQKLQILKQIILNYKDRFEDHINFIKKQDLNQIIGLNNDLKLKFDKEKAFTQKMIYYLKLEQKIFKKSPQDRKKSWKQKIKPFQQHLCILNNQCKKIIQESQTNIEYQPRQFFQTNYITVYGQEQQNLNQLLNDGRTNGLKSKSPFSKSKSKQYPKTKPKDQSLSQFTFGPLRTQIAQNKQILQRTQNICSKIQNILCEQTDIKLTFNTIKNVSNINQFSYLKQNELVREKLINYKDKTLQLDLLINYFKQMSNTHEQKTTNKIQTKYKKNITEQIYQPRSLLGPNRKPQIIYAKNLRTRNRDIQTKQQRTLKLIPENCPLIFIIKDTYINDNITNQNIEHSPSTKQLKNKQFSNISKSQIQNLNIFKTLNSSSFKMKNSKNQPQKSNQKQSQNRTNRDFSPDNRIKSANIPNLVNVNVNQFKSIKNQNANTASFRQPYSYKQNQKNNNRVQTNHNQMYRTTRISNVKHSDYTQLKKQDNDVLKQAQQLHLPHGPIPLQKYYGDSIQLKIQTYVKKNTKEIKNVQQKVKYRKSRHLKDLQNKKQLDYFSKLRFTSIPLEKVLQEKTQSQNDQQPRRIYQKYQRQRQNQDDAQSQSDLKKILGLGINTNQSSKKQQASSVQKKTNVYKKPIKSSLIQECLQTLKSKQPLTSEIKKAQKPKQNTTVIIDQTKNKAVNPFDKNKTNNVLSDNKKKNIVFGNLTDNQKDTLPTEILVPVLIKSAVSDDQSDQNKVGLQNNLPTFVSPPQNTLKKQTKQKSSSKELKNQSLNLGKQSQKPPIISGIPPKKINPTSVIQKQNMPIQGKQIPVKNQQTNIFTKNKIAPQKNLFNQNQNQNQRNTGFGQQSNIFNKGPNDVQVTNQNSQPSTQFSFNPNQFQNQFGGINNAKSFTNIQQYQGQNPPPFQGELPMNGFPSFGPQSFNSFQGPQSNMNPLNLLHHQLNQNPNQNLFANQMNQNYVPPNTNPSYFQPRK